MGWTVKPRGGQCEQKLEAPREEGDPGKKRQGQVSEAHVAGV